VRGNPTGGGPRDRSLVILNCAAFYRYRRDNPVFDRFVLAAIEERIRVSNPILCVAVGTFKYEWDPRDYHRIRAMLPESFPDKDVVINEVIVSLLEGRLDRSQIAARIRWYVSDYNRMFPTKYAKFGNQQLLSLDEALFEDGTTTRGDTVSHGLWD
jgi:hypothetical protein